MTVHPVDLDHVRPLSAPPVQESAPAPAVLSARGLQVSFERAGRRVLALRGVDLDIRPGEIVGLVGESGSGKTVLGLSALGLLPAADGVRTEGELVVDGVDVLHAGPREMDGLRRRLGAVFQDPMTSLNPTMRIGDQVCERTGDRNAAIELLESVGIPDASDRMRRFPHELSGGQRQRIMIAMAVAGSPRLIVADEPTTALDVTVQAQILRLLADLRDRIDCSVLFITHDLAVAAEVADRIVVAYAGRLVEMGPTSLIQQPAHPYTAGLLDSRLTLATPTDRPLPTIVGEQPDPTSEFVGCAFASRCPSRVDECEQAPPQAVTATHGGWVACVRPERTTARDADASAWPPSTAPTGTFGLELVGVHVSFTTGRGRKRRTVEALRGLDLRVAPGESVAIVGESGSGKSTLLRVVAGLLTPDRGDVALRSGARPQMVFQDAGASLTPWLRIGDQVGERLREEGLDRSERAAKVDEALQLVGLPTAVAELKPAQLSGGQRQRVGLARAIVVPPTLLLCDEPTSALDVSLAAVVLNLLGEIRRRLGMSMLFVTHDLCAARIVADRIVVVKDGAIVEELVADELESARHPYTRTLLDAIPGTRILLGSAPATGREEAS